MALVYKSICNEADSLIVYMMHLSDKEVRYKVEMEKLMHKGYVNIAKARYIMGSTCVTKMQLPSESSNPIKPVATVCRAEYNGHWVFHVHRADTKRSSVDSFGKEENDTFPSFVYSEHEPFLNSGADKDTRNRTESNFKLVLKNDPKALKKSKNAFNVDDRLYKDFNDELLDELSTDSESNGSLVSVTDPIRLFGILVPNTLKNAQNIFKDVVNLLGKCATIQAELDMVLHRYNYLMEVKKLIEQAAKEIKMKICKPRIYWTPSVTSSVSSHVGEVEEEEEEGEGEEDKKEKDEIEVIQGPTAQVSVKSIRSVFFDMKSHDEEKEDEFVIDKEEKKELDQQEVVGEEWGSDDDQKLVVEDK